ncbi:MAG: succinylglutamate desuccinylase, partial [Plesiomonas sp.]
MRQAALLNGDFLALTLAHEWHLPAGEFELENGTLVSVWDTGVIVFTPMYPGERDIILSCGIHGNETAPIELLAQMVQGLLLEQWAVQQRVMFVFGNPAAMNANVREIRDNLNRLFSGTHLGGRSRERDRAAKLEAYVDRFFREGGYRDEFGESGGAKRERCHYDLHTALRASRHERFAIYPFRHGEPYSHAQLEFLAACDIRTVLLMHCPTTTFSYFTAREFDAH